MHLRYFYLNTPKGRLRYKNYSEYRRILDGAQFEYTFTRRRQPRRPLRGDVYYLYNILPEQAVTRAELRAFLVTFPTGVGRKKLKAKWQRNMVQRVMDNAQIEKDAVIDWINIAKKIFDIHDGGDDRMTRAMNILVRRKLVEVDIRLFNHTEKSS